MSSSWTRLSTARPKNPSRSERTNQRISPDGARLAVNEPLGVGRLLVCELHPIQSRINPGVRDQLFVRAGLHHVPLVKDDDAIRGPNRRQPVGDDQRRSTPYDLFEGALEASLRVRVDARGRLVEHQQGCVAVNGSRERQELALPGAEVLASLIDASVERARWSAGDIDSAAPLEEL